jgi:hypothetical protein
MCEDAPLLRQTLELLRQDFELPASEDTFTEEELLDLLADRIAYLIEHRLEFLLSLMYRLDVEEHRINHALSPHCAEPANVALARLVLERQKRRVETKRTYRQEPGDWWNF